MTLLKESYKELLALTQLFIQREYSSQKELLINPPTLAFFQKFQETSFSMNPIKKERFFPSTTSSPRIDEFKASTPPSPLPEPRPEPTPPPPTQPEPPPQPNPEPSKPNPTPPPAQPEPQPPMIHKNPKEESLLALDPINASTISQDFGGFWKNFPHLFPHIRLFESIPADSFAKKIKNIWLNEQTIPPILILSFHEEEKQLRFLKNIAQAITLRLAPARVFSASKWEKEKRWESLLTSPNLHLIITSDYGLYLQPGLMHYYREIPQQGKHFLLQTPLFLLSDLSLYFKEPQLKSLLWRAICNEFAISQRSISSR